MPIGRASPHRASGAYPTSPARIFAAKHHAVEGSWRVVDTALEVAGGFGIFKKGGLERLFRDARLGRIHMANAWAGPLPQGSTDLRRK